MRQRSPHAIIAIVSGFIPDEIYSEEASCVDVMIPKPVDLGIFVRLLNKVERIAQSRKKIRDLGAVLVEVD